MAKQAAELSHRVNELLDDTFDLHEWLEADLASIAGGVFGGSADTIETLAVAGWFARQMNYVLFEFVVNLRSRGTSWAEIGDALGISRQAALKRFTRDPSEALTSLRRSNGS